MENSARFLTNNSSVLRNEENDLCEPGLLLPFIPYEYTWSPPVRATLYCCGLIYCFMGLAIVADAFMGSIEKITSKTKKIHIPNANGGRNNDAEAIEVRIWNDTVANLSLMALGSSAPEILLSCIEIIKNDFQVGALGPGSIVGSAAFNLLVICATCIIAIPNGETRKIRMFSVFLITTGFSLFAYIWLLVILKYSSTDVVEVWEALLTFLFFPILVLIAWRADRAWTKKHCERTLSVADQQIENGPINCDLKTDQLKNYGSIRTRTEDLVRHTGPIRNPEVPMKMESDGEASKTGKDERKLLIPRKVNKKAFLDAYKEVRKFSHLSDSDTSLLVATKLIDSQPRSRLWYRIGAVRSLTGGKRVRSKLPDQLKTVYKAINSCTTEEIQPNTSGKAIVEFRAECYAVPEKIGKFNITVIRRGRLDNTVRVRVDSFDGTAKAGLDYFPVNEQLAFAPFTKERQLSISIIDDHRCEPDEEFFLRLSIVDEGMYGLHGVTLGNLSLTEIIILDDNEAGLVSFKRKCVLVKETCKFVAIDVKRVKGADGVISVQWKTVNGSGKSPEDYRAGEGTLIFKNGETLCTIEIQIVDDINLEGDKTFEIELMNPTGGAKLGRIPKIMVIISNEDFSSVLQRTMLATSHNIESMQVHHVTWSSQIQAALNVRGGDFENATNFDYLMHFLTFGWKVMFSLLPPSSYCGGWLCFCCSLCAIGLLTALVGDLASIFGCLIGLKDSVTAITFVTLGTSLPDLFASKTAARSDKYADNAVGNFTGSNCVNVFLGLGLPWSIAAIYHTARGSTFKVPSGGLGFSVAVYSTVAFIGLGLILMRRFLSLFGNAELGGPSLPKYLSGIFLILLWLVFVIVLSLNAYDYI